jgi:CRP/FNR family nitrogen fixation transcriptional regulator
VSKDNFQNAQITARKNGSRSRGALSKAFGKSLDQMGFSTKYRRTEKLFDEGDASHYIYKVESGCVKTYNTFKDNRRHVREFYLPGDCIGLGVLRDYDCSADAIAPSVVRVISKKELMVRAASNITLLNNLLEETTSELRRTRDHKALLLKSAEARVASFLIEIAKRGSHRGRIGMPMIRQEVADHLGLTCETVSRILWRLKRSKIISLPARQTIVLKNLSALNRMAA